MSGNNVWEGILTVIVAVVVESLVCRRGEKCRVCCKVLRATALRLSEWRPQVYASPDRDETTSHTTPHLCMRHIDAAAAPHHLL